jgi:hypothetical protein
MWHRTDRSKDRTSHMSARMVTGQEQKHLHLEVHRIIILRTYDRFANLSQEEFGAFLVRPYLG